MEIRLLTGPLDEPWLGAIADLYGRFNGKYGDPSFCRCLFNHNPSGYSLHAFLIHDSGQVVGHYGIIPMDIVVDGQRRRSGKCEAFVVHPDHRDATLAQKQGGPITCGLAMPLHLYRHALEHGLEVVHMVADAEVGLIHRMTGCRGLATRHRRAVLELRPVEVTLASLPAWKRAIRLMLGAGQRLAFGLSYAATLGWLGRVRCWSGAEVTSERLARIAADIPPVTGWTLAIDSPTLAWMARTGEVQVFALDDAMKNYAVACGRAGHGDSMEIIYWRQRSGGSRSALRLLGAVVRRARQLGKSAVAYSHGAAWQPSDLSGLRTAGRLLFFHERAQHSGLYVRASDPYYLDPKNLHFTPFFYAAF